MKTKNNLPSLFLPLLLAMSAAATDGLIGKYYTGYSVVSNRIVLDGLTLINTQTNTAFDYWDGSQYYDWNPIGGGFYSVQWTGFLHTTETGLYGFGTISDDGSEIWIDGGFVVDNNEDQWYDWQEAYCHLGTGYHTIEVKFYEHNSFSGIEVWWLRPSQAPSVLPYSGETFHTIPPSFNSDTKWEILSAPAVQTDAPFVNPRLTARLIPATNAVELTWQGFTNVTYSVESSTNLVVWQDWTSGLTGISAVMTQAVTLTAPQQFFRVRLEE